MGLLRWLRGRDDEAASTAGLSAGLAALDEVFHPGRRKQTEHVEQEKLRRVSIGDAAPPVDVDLDLGTAVIRRDTEPHEPTSSI